MALHSMSSASAHKGVITVGCLGLTLSLSTMYVLRFLNGFVAKTATNLKMVSNGFKSSTRLQTQLPGNDFQWPVSAKSRTDRAVLESGLPCSVPIRGALSKAVRFSDRSTSSSTRTSTGGGASHVERRTNGVYGHPLFRNNPPHAWPSPPLAQTRPLDLCLGAETLPLLVDKACERENLHGGRPWDSAQA